MNALIAGWRKAWGLGEFPFLHMQKPSGGGCAWEPGPLIGNNVLPTSL
jgi:sialate O-acetylesterase